jgi:hypothetical protein
MHVAAYSLNSRCVFYFIKIFCESDEVFILSFKNNNKRYKFGVNV